MAVSLFATKVVTTGIVMNVIKNNSCINVSTTTKWTESVFWHYTKMFC